jgi:hypothetical protein
LSEVIEVSEGAKIQFPAIHLNAAANKLNEVTVQKKKPVVEHKIDKTVVNVDAVLSVAGGDAMDVLEKSPGIIVDQNGTITFKGNRVLRCLSMTNLRIYRVPS